jgi:hypothetical protein
MAACSTDLCAMATAVGTPLGNVVTWLGGMLGNPPGNIVLLSAIFGAFGGLVTHFINNEKQALFGKPTSTPAARRHDPPPADKTKASDDAQPADKTKASGDAQPADKTKASADAEKAKWYLFPSALQSALIGAAGALGFLFFIIAVSGINDNLKSVDYLRIIAIGVIAGLGARNLLPGMVGQIEKQILQRAENAANKAEENQQKVAADTEKVQKVVNTVTKTSEDNFRDRLLISAAAQAAYSEKEKDPQRPLFIEKLEERRRGARALDANGYIVLARLYRVQNDLPKAIEVLASYLGAAGKVTPPNQAYHTVLYNLACYRCVRGAQVGDKQLLEHALDDLAEALKYSENPETDKAYAREDDDLAALKQDPRFQELTKRVEPAPQTATNVAPDPSTTGGTTPAPPEPPAK